MEHMPNLDLQLMNLLEQDKLHLENTKIPIVTVSASFKEDLKGLYGLPENEELPDVVLSRAHFSMALGVAIQAWGHKIDPEKAWLVDPTNFVSQKDWRSIQITESIGKLLARWPTLKKLKDLIDQFGRQKLPILKSITPPLLYLFERVDRPILSLHIASGNILVEHGKTVLQVITDPHVRDDYLANADNPRMSFCVFDNRTKMEFLEKAALRGLKVDPNKVTVTGPPIDPRVTAAGKHKKTWQAGAGPLRLCLTTGGLGTNKQELEVLLEQLLPELHKKPHPYQLLVYTSTQKDIAEMVKRLAKKHKVRLGSEHDAKASFRLLYHPQIMDANELLITYGFPWAHGFITKPSGDMAYDAPAAGCFLLTLAEWGEWEHNVRQVFEQRDIARKAEVETIVTQLTLLATPNLQGKSWFEQAQCHALGLDKLFLFGSEEIIKVFKKLSSGVN